MARGWESKSVEAQQEERARRAAEPRRPGADDRAALAREAASEAARRRLELARLRAVADLAAARSPAHRATLEAAIRALDEELDRIARRA
jgi:hypothetical protein